MVFKELGLLYCLSEGDVVTDWIQILITFRTTCYHCRKEIPPGQALWSNSAKAAKHLRCKHKVDESVLTKEKFSIETSVPQNKSDDSLPSSISPLQIIDLKCFSCGAKTGCNECIFLTECVQRFDSKEYCICKCCSSNSLGGYEKYKQIFVQNIKTNMNV
jgi:hypothetical protein